MAHQNLPANPWEYLQPHDVARFGQVILDPEEQRRWSSAVLLGGLPYMWRKLADERALIYSKLNLSLAKRILLIGESNESCGFVDDLRSQISADAEVRSIDVLDRARDMCLSGQKGKNGSLGTWRWDYVDDVPDNYYDAIAILQGVQHTEDWSETAPHLIRVLKPGGAFATGELSLGPPFEEKANADVHLLYLIEKIYAGFNLEWRALSYWSVTDLRQAFGNSLVDQGWYVYRGLESFWGRKPLLPDVKQEQNEK